MCTHVDVTVFVISSMLNFVSLGSTFMSVTSNISRGNDNMADRYVPAGDSAATTRPFNFDIFSVNMLLTKTCKNWIPLINNI
jgi:hypothetical protein